MPPKKKYETRAVTERNLLQNFNQVSNSANNTKLKTISLSNALKQMKMENEKKLKNTKKKNKTNNSKPIPEPNYLPRPLGWRKTKETNKKVEKSKSLSPLRFKTRPKKNYHKTNVPNVIVQNTKRKKGGVLNSLPNEYFQNKK